MIFVKLYFLAVPIFFLIDMLWLGLIAKGFYQKQLADFLSPNVNWTAAIIFYLIYIVGILFFAVWPAFQEGSLSKALLYGALFGFFTYATYDLTNLATLKDWPLIVVVVDIIWGAILCLSVSGLSYLLGKTLLI